MDTRRFRQHARSVAAFRWLGWVMLMMFVLVQAVHATAADARKAADAAGAPARSEPAQASVEFAPDTHQVTVETSVPPALWNATPDIGAHSFVVYEDNVRQRIKDVTAVDGPISIGMLVEHGGRYHAFNEALADEGSRAVQELKAALNPPDKIRVWTYGSTVEPLEASPESSGGTQLTGLPLSVAPSSESNFYDAVLNVLPQVQQMPGRRVLVVVSSGIDTFSQADFQQVVSAAAEGGVPICPIDIGPTLRTTLSSVDGSDDTVYGHLDWRLASEQLAHLARVSGCRALRPTSSLDLPAAYDGLLANLRLKYVIRYQTAALALPGTRHVRIEWADGLRGKTKIAHTDLRDGRAGKLLADVRYTVSSTAMLTNPTVPTNPTAPTWPFLDYFSDSAIHIPLKSSPGRLSGQEVALLAATQANEAPSPN